MISLQPGVGPESLEGQSASGSILAYPGEIYQTPLIDISQPLSNLELIPARIGYFPVFIAGLGGMCAIESVTGTQTSPVHIQAGNNAAHTNLFATTTLPSNADVNGASVPSLTTLNPPTNLLTMIQNATVFFDITVPAVGTGGFKCLARFAVVVVWMSVEGNLI